MNQAVETTEKALRGGVYHSRDCEYVAIAKHKGGWLVVGADGKVEWFAPADMPLRRRANCLDREHETAASLVRTIAFRRGKQLRTFARDQLRKLLEGAEL